MDSKGTKRITALVLIFMILILFSSFACKQKQEAANDSAAKKSYKIALVMKTLTNPFFVTMEQGARQAEKDLGIELIVKTGAQETSIEQQIAIVEQLIKDKVAAIVIAPAGSVELVPVLKKAMDSGIKVVNIDNKLDEAACQRLALTDVPYISVDNEEGAYLSANHIVKMVKAPAQAMIFEGILTAKNAQDRKNGALRAFGENPQIKVVNSQSANWKIDEAYELATKTFAKYPKVELLFCANDMMAMGAIQYLKEKGKTNVKVASFDNLQEVQALLETGMLKATVDQQANRQGYMGIETAYKMLSGEPVESLVLIPVKLITGK